jgi:hypothetical protein
VGIHGTKEIKMTDERIIPPKYAVDMPVITDKAAYDEVYFVYDEVDFIDVTEAKHPENWGRVSQKVNRVNLLTYPNPHRGGPK